MHRMTMEGHVVDFPLTLETMRTAYREGTMVRMFDRQWHIVSITEKAFGNCFGAPYLTIIVQRGT